MDITPQSIELVTVLETLAAYRWQHGELEKRVRGLTSVLIDTPTFPTDPEDGKWPWFRIIGWKPYRLYLPRKNNEGLPVTGTAVRSHTDSVNEAELVWFTYLLMGRQSCP